ncbi:unnamed protein product [Sphenostylis stenocarpa]|uniref:WRKY domain-containing protein n=1 Tax=Sphenostylis stenocarpa TaxID=92480 RepID=A0AA86W232_9FABA|nr:unnamed protein product [Sphenostylis stenocarpa]
MDEDWDLFAVVRSCQSTTNTSTTAIPQTTTNNSLSSLLTSTVKDQKYDAFSFPNNTVQPITDEFHELHQLFTPFNPTTPTIPSAPGINPNSPYFAEQESQQISDHLPIWPHFLPEPSTPSFNRFPNHQQQQQNQLQVLQKQEFHAPQNSSPTVSPNTQPQTPKSRKRKSQQKKMVCQVTADNLSADLWAWRKYGQKPIKGSPYPSYTYIFVGITIGVAAPKVVWLENKLNGVTLKPICSLLPTPETTRIPGQSTGTRLPEVPGVRLRRRIRHCYPGHFPFKMHPFLLHRHTLPRRHQKIHRKPVMSNPTRIWKLTWTMTVTFDDPITAFLCSKFCIEVTLSQT